MRFGKLHFLIIITLLSLTISCNGAGRKILWFSDIHFNPFFDPDIVEQLVEENYSQWDHVFQTSAAHTKLPVLGNESNRSILESTLSEMKSSCPSPDFIIYSGDFLTHHFNSTYQKITGDTTEEGLRRFIDSTIEYLVSRFEFYFPATPFYFCLGNNDTYKGDYFIEQNDDFLKNTSSIFEGFFKESTNRDLFNEKYAEGGYYRVNIPGTCNGQILVLNALFLSEIYPEQDIDPAEAQFEWIENQLSAAPWNKTWIIMHIPLGVDVFATLKANKDLSEIKEVIPLLKEKHLERLIDIIDRTKPHITAVLSGHIHRDSFRLIYKDSDRIEDTLPASVLFTVPSISPVYYNNPGFNIITYNPQRFTVLDYETHYVDINSRKDSWQEGYVFCNVYGTTELTPANMQNLWISLQTDTQKRNSFISAYNAFSKSDINEDNFKYYRAAAGYLRSDDYRSVVNSMVLQDLYKSYNVEVPGDEKAYCIEKKSEAAGY